MKLSEMKEILSKRQIQLTKSLGQNFLHDGNQLRRIVDAGAIRPTDNILEIGPGLGPLTELIAMQAGKVLAIEMDFRLFEVLKERFKTVSNVELLHADALAYLKGARHDWKDWKLVANLPYSVASPILVELAQAQTCPERLVATLQLEVANRIMAQTDDDHYGLLTLLLQLRYQPTEIFKIPGSCFHPSPDVDSACITLVRRETPLLDPAGSILFTRIVKLAFSQRRKMMLKLLKGSWPLDTLQLAFEKIGISPMARAEAVSLLQFVELTRMVSE
jgi:16S rRNA (adenine1518-N6/adenine1519-N6)-dimethyltransferase